MIWFLARGRTKKIQKPRSRFARQPHRLFRTAETPQSPHPPRKASSNKGKDDFHVVPHMTFLLPPPFSPQPSLPRESGTGRAVASLAKADGQNPCPFCN